MKLYVILGIVNIPVYVFLAKLFFNTWDELGEAIAFWITPDIISAFRGEFWEDWWAELKLGVWILSCVGIVSAEAQLLPMFLP
jgi:hypothetical protein